MAPITPSSATLEIVQNEKGKLSLRHNGVYVPGVVRIDISQSVPSSPDIVVTFHARAVRFVTLPVIEGIINGED